MGLFDDLDDLIKEVDSIDAKFAEIDGTAAPKLAPPPRQPVESPAFPIGTRDYAIFDNVEKLPVIENMSEQEFWRALREAIPHLLLSTDGVGLVFWSHEGYAYTPETAVLQWRHKISLCVGYTTSAQRVLGLPPELREFLNNFRSPEYRDKVLTEAMIAGGDRLGRYK